MGVNYIQVLSADMILKEVETLVDWHGHVLRQRMFPAAKGNAISARASDVLLAWCHQEAEKGTVDKKFVEKFALVYEELCVTAQKVLDATDGLPVELYDLFELQFEAYITHINRLQQEVSSTGVGIDQITGLRTAAGVKNDIRREQDRFDRKGTSFSVACVAIDKMPELQQKYDRRTMDMIYAAFAKSIAKNLRSFDDAYFFGQGEYMIVLKHVEFIDACSVMDRMINEIRANALFLPTGERVFISASLGIAEAITKETPTSVIQNAKSALSEARQQGNCIREYREKSPLERYAENILKV